MIDIRKIAAASALAVLLALQVISSIAATSAPSSITMDQWVQGMNSTPTPGKGCFESSYPSTTWKSVQCSPPQGGSFIAGGGNDWSANSINYAATGAQGVVTSETGYSSESDSTHGYDWYSMQVNTQEYSITYGGKSTTAWEQFVFANQGVPLYTYGYALIQYTLINYHYYYSNCPSGWTQDHNNCYQQTGWTNTGYEDPAYLTKYTLTGTVSSTTDTSKFCDSNKGNCYASTGADTLSLYSGNWWDTEFNVLGYNSGTRANFNSGISLGIKTNNYQNGQSCGTISITGETNNLNLGTCSGGSSQQYITFSES